MRQPALRSARARRPGQRRRPGALGITAGILTPSWNLQLGERGGRGVAASRPGASVSGIEPTEADERGRPAAGEGQILCGPKTSSTSCDQAIFVDQATDASLLPDATLAEVDWLG